MSASDGTDQGFFDSNYLVDQQQCTAGSGNWDGDASNKRPNSPFQDQVDQHGVLMLTFVGGVSPANSCFVQVIAVPA